jgi:hypothetical protein
MRSGEGMPRESTSSSSKLASLSDIAAFRKRFGAVRFEKGNSRGSPRGAGSASADLKRRVLTVELIMSKMIGTSYDVMFWFDKRISDDHTFAIVSYVIRNNTIDGIYYMYAVLS